MGPVGPGTMNHCAGEGQQKFSSQSFELVVRQSSAGKDVNTEAEEYKLLGAVTKQRLVQT
jgi:hypothetical protein